jgi:hypothetical protein
MPGESMLNEQQPSDEIETPEIVIYSLDCESSLAICSERNVCSPYGDCRHYEWG